MSMPGMPGSGGGMKTLLIALVVLGLMAGGVFWMMKVSAKEPENPADNDDNDDDADDTKTKPPGTKPPGTKPPGTKPPGTKPPKPVVVKTKIPAPAPIKPIAGSPVVVVKSKCDQECAKKCKDPKSSKCGKCMTECNGGGAKPAQVCKPKPDKEMNSYCRNLKCKKNDTRGACDKCMDCKDKKQEGFMMFESFENSYPVLHALQTYRNTIAA